MIASLVSVQVSIPIYCLAVRDHNKWLDWIWFFCCLHSVSSHSILFLPSFLPSFFLLLLFFMSIWVDQCRFGLFPAALFLFMTFMFLDRTNNKFYFNFIVWIFDPKIQFANDRTTKTAFKHYLNLKSVKCYFNSFHFVCDFVFIPLFFLNFSHSVIVILFKIF